MASARVSAAAGPLRSATPSPAVKIAVSKRPRKLFDIPYPRSGEKVGLYDGVGGPDQVGFTLSFFHMQVSEVLQITSRRRNHVSLRSLRAPSASHRTVRDDRRRLRC